MLEFAPSRPIVLLARHAEWAAEAGSWCARLRQVLPGDAFDLAHIGSTAVPGLVAKDVLDLQLGVTELDPQADWARALAAAGFQWRPDTQADDFAGRDAGDLRKLYFREPQGQRRVHLHVRRRGAFNHRFALLFRDYLRACPEAREAYQMAKQRAAQLFPQSVDGYLFLKEPVFLLIHQAAEAWAEAGHKQP